MINDFMSERIRIDEYEGEKIISIVRLVLASIYLGSIPFVSIIRNFEGYGHIPLRGNIFTSIFFLYSVFLFFFVRRKENPGRKFKYICVTFDTLIISASIWLTCTYLEIAPP